MSGNVDPSRSLTEVEFIVTEGFQSFVHVCRITHGNRDAYVESPLGGFSLIYSYSFRSCQIDYRDPKPMENISPVDPLNFKQERNQANKMGLR